MVVDYPPKQTIAVVSMSGGKDSLATAICAKERVGDDRCRYVFADTGNEHELTLEYLYGYLARVLGPIVTLRADFSAEIARKRVYVAEKWPEKGVPDVVIQRALAVLHPTGVPFLDLCLWKGRFPSRKAQFCTQELKRRPLDAYMLERLAEGYEVESWRGIRRDESQNRRHTLEVERAAEGWLIVHPVVGMTAQEVIEFVLSRGIMLNPLYTRGMRRVGCMPCINCGKDELLEIAKRFPVHIDRIREWEQLLCLAAKRGWTTFFTDAAGDDESDEDIFLRLNIDARVRWAETARGGRQLDFVRTEPAAACSSVYGLCE